MNLEGRALALVNESRLAHLATVDARGRPHVVPVCYAYHTGRFYFVVDEKPKRHANRLKRMRNIGVNPHVALVIDRYDEDWTRLAYVLVHGTAHMVAELSEWQFAVQLLEQRYQGYRAMKLTFPHNVAVRIQIERWHYWQAAS